MHKFSKSHEAQTRPIFLTIYIGMLAMGLTIPPRIAGGQSASTQPASTETKLPIYDVVSIKLNKSHSGDSDVTTRPGRFSTTNVQIKEVLEYAYGIKKALIYGIPGPIDSARFDIEAKVSEPDLAAIRRLPLEQRRSMLLPVLTEYFHLNAHIEVRTLPVFDLVVTKGGPKFHESPKDTKESIGVRNTVLEAHGVSMASFATTLTNRPGVDRMVVDNTGLRSVYDLAMKWSRDDGEKLDNGTGDDAPPLFTALQEQLGLKLVPAKGPVDTLVVDHVELPSEN